VQHAQLRPQSASRRSTAMDAKQYSALGLDAPHHTKTDGTITENGYAPGEPNTGGMKNINNPEHTQSKNQPYELTEEAT
jgi:hypothetical protein